MSFFNDTRLFEAKALDPKHVVGRLGISNLRQSGADLIGPCPLCGGRDRFGINIGKKAFNCRKCALSGGDMIALVMGVQGMDFKQALTWLCGSAPSAVSATEQERRRQRALRADEEARVKQEGYRKAARCAARKMWESAKGKGCKRVQAYLLGRGIDIGLLGRLPLALRELPSHPYVKRIGKTAQKLYCGPCMLAAIQGSDGKHIATHQTWITDSAPYKKAEIFYAGDKYPSKLVRGAKKGGAIRLHTPPGADTLIVGEGIETTLSALAAKPVEGAAYWAGVDLGNMSGRMVKVSGRKYSGVPDMSDHEAWLPPEWVKHLIFIMDGDSDPDMTRAKLECGLRRAMSCRLGMKAQIVPAPSGFDLNDVLRGVGP